MAIAFHVHNLLDKQSPLYNLVVIWRLILNSKEMFEVLERVRTWDTEMRIDLARRILETLVSSKISPPPRTMSPEDVFGILKTGRPPPTDEECKKIIEEERLKKYG